MTTRRGLVLAATSASAIGAIGIGLFSPRARAAADPLLIGQSGGFTGGQAEYSRDVKNGIEACFTMVNAGGGVGGRPLRLLTEDDGGKRDAVLANTKKLSETDKVLALIGYTSGAGTENSLAYITGAKVPILSPATGNMGIRAAHNPFLFHTRAGYGDEMAKIVGHVASFGYKRIAIAYLEDVGPANPKAMRDALAAHQLTAVAAVGLDRNAEDFSAQVAALLGATPQMVIFISNAKPIAKIVQGMRAGGYHGEFATSSFSGPRVISDLKELARGLVMIQVLPRPSRSHLKYQKEFHAGLKKVAPEAKPNYTMLEGYIGARVLVEGLQRAGANPSRERLVAALDGLSDFDIDGYRIGFSKTNHNGSRFVDLGVVNGRGELNF